MISAPTRVTKDSRTSIDHFHTTGPHKIISKGVSVVSINDHYLIYSIKETMVSKENAKIIEYRDSKHLSEQAFLQELQNCLSDFNEHLGYDPNASQQIWKNTFYRIWNKHAPVKKRMVGATNLDSVDGRNPPRWSDSILINPNPDPNSKPLP